MSSRPKKLKKNGINLSSTLKISKKFRSKKGFLSNIVGNEIPQVGEYVYYMPELWKVISETSLGMYQVESCLLRTRKVSTLEHLAPANIWSRALQTERELQNQCLELEKLKSTNSSLQKTSSSFDRNWITIATRPKRQQEKFWTNGAPSVRRYALT